MRRHRFCCVVHANPHRRTRSPTALARADPGRQDAAKASAASLKKAHPTTAFENIQRAESASGDRGIVGISGNRALFRVWNDRLSKWGAPFILLRMRDLQFEGIRNVDATGDGQTDFLLTGTAPSQVSPMAPF